MVYKNIHATFAIFSFYNRQTARQTDKTQSTRRMIPYMGSATPSSCSIHLHKVSTAFHFQRLKGIKDLEKWAVASDTLSIFNDLFSFIVYT